MAFLRQYYWTGGLQEGQRSLLGNPRAVRQFAPLEEQENSGKKAGNNGIQINLPVNGIH